MGQYFALILNNSVTVSILIAVLLVFRGLCKKISRRMICFLWIVAAIKLISKYRESGLPGGRRADGTPTGSGQGFCFVLSGYSGCCLVRRSDFDGWLYDCNLYTP